MKLEEVIPALREGKKITRSGGAGVSFHVKTLESIYELINSINRDDMHADNWEVVEEPATYEEIEAHFRERYEFYKKVKSPFAAATYNECAEILKTRKIPK